MKKIYQALALLAGAIVLTQACTNKLDIPQQGVQNEENSYITDEDCENAITAVYAAWRSAWSGSGYAAGNTYTNLFWMKNLMVDELSSSHSNQSELSNSTVTPSNPWISGCYKMLYKTVYLANIVLDKFSPESEVKEHCIAEAKFFRALSYYELITLWGQVPLVEHVLEKPEDYQVGPASYADLWAFVEKDLTEAIASGRLPSKSGIDDKETGTRTTLEAAYAVRGKVLLTEEKFSEAQADFKKVIDSHLYGLIPDMADLYHTQANGCREYIFENVRHWDSSNIYGPNTSAKQDGWYGLEEAWPISGFFTITEAATFPFVTAMGGGWGSMTPTRKVYDAFVAEEGAQSSRRLASVLGLDDLPLFGVTYDGGGYGWVGNEGVLRFKWLMSQEDEWDVAWTGRLNNTPCMRYADVLLMMAEACVRGGQNGDAYVNEVRARSGLPAKSGVTLADVKTERQLELCFEATRFQDLKRWGDLATELSDKGKRIPTLMPGWIVTYATNPDPAAGFQAGKDELLPFPLVELQTNKALQQNPGY